MNLKLIEDILSSNFSDKDKECLILDSLAKDENVIPNIIKILEIERNFKKDVITNMNYVLSLADTVIDEPKRKEGSDIQNKILDFYKKYKGVVGHCFKNLEL